eukprot:scaffold742_cov263-Pinguiococcus_pyrenoidosus.AAC.5
MERLVAQLQRMKALEESEANLVTNILEKMPESARFSVLVSDLLHAKGRPTSLGSPAVALARWEDHEDDEGAVYLRVGATLSRSASGRSFRRAATTLWALWKRREDTFWAKVRCEAPDKPSKAPLKQRFYRLCASFLIKHRLKLILSLRYGPGNVSELGVGAAAGSAVYGFVHRLDNGGEMVGSEAALAAAVSGDVVDLGVGVERRTSLLGPASRLGVCAFAPTRERYLIRGCVQQTKALR